MITLNSYLGAHRAFPDVQAMEAVMTHPSLVSCLTNLPIRSPKRQIELWSTQKAVHQQSASLVKALGKPTISKAQAKKLGELGLGIATLKTLRTDCPTPEAFMEALKAKGVKSKPLRKNLSMNVLLQ